mmetsp:Transcript_97244/g.274176  ORF Transcript_97244/g.274176 Transcript_97244/m.274176 type:complete len:292 (-) Transcript_97244:316-1191(-)
MRMRGTMRHATRPVPARFEILYTRKSAPLLLRSFAHTAAKTASAFGEKPYRQEDPQRQASSHHIHGDAHRLEATLVIDPRERLSGQRRIVDAQKVQKWLPATANVEGRETLCRELRLKLSLKTLMEIKPSLPGSLRLEGGEPLNHLEPRHWPPNVLRIGRILPLELIHGPQDAPVESHVKDPAPRSQDEDAEDLIDFAPSFDPRLLRRPHAHEDLGRRSQFGEDWGEEVHREIQRGRVALCFDFHQQLVHRCRVLGCFELLSSHLPPSYVSELHHRPGVVDLVAETQKRGL